MKTCKIYSLVFLISFLGVFSIFAQTESELIYILEDDERLAINEYHLITGTGSAGWSIVVNKSGQGAQVIMEDKRLGPYSFGYVTQEAIISPYGNVWFMILKHRNEDSCSCISNNGTEYGPFDAVEPGSFLFKAEGDWSFVFHKENETYIQMNKGVIGPFYRTYEHIKRRYYYQTGSYSYTKREEGLYLKKNGAEYGPYKRFQMGPRNNDNWSMVGVKAEGEYVLVNGEEYGPYNDVLCILFLNDSLWVSFISSEGTDKVEGALINGVEYSGFDKIDSILYVEDKWILTVKKKEDNGKEFSYLVSDESEFGPFDTIMDVQIIDDSSVWYAAVEKSGNQYIINSNQDEYPVEKCKYLLIDKATEQWTALLKEKGVWNIRSEDGSLTAVYDSFAYEPPRKPTTSFDWRDWENQREKHFFNNDPEGPMYWMWEWFGERWYRPDFALIFPDGEEYPNAFNLFPERHNNYITFYFYTIDGKDIYFHKKRVNIE